MRLSLLFLTAILAGQMWGQGQKHASKCNIEFQKHEQKLKKETSISKDDWDETTYEKQNKRICTLGEESFGETIKRTNEEFEAFLDSINEDYAQYLKKEWKTISFRSMHQLQKDKEEEPVFEKEQKYENLVLKGEIVDVKTDSYSHPQPPYNIRENDETNISNTFYFYGTTMEARWGDANKFKFSSTSINKQELSDAYKFFSDKKFKNLLFDCLEIRDKYDLCDWAYYKMLQAMTETIFGKGTNESLFLQGVLLGQSGYSMRFAIDNLTNHLYLLCKINEEVSNFPTFSDKDDGTVYYLFEKDLKTNDLDFCPKSYKGEQEMSLKIPALPKLDNKLTDEKVIYDRNNTIRLSYQINQNLINFFDDYPIHYRDSDLFTRWVNYANSPVSKEIRNYVYPKLWNKIKDYIPDHIDHAADIILSWICPIHIDEFKKEPEDGQIGIRYIDDNIFPGYDRTFFPDETLKYTGGDCEDHAILFSRIIRDLLELDVVLVYFPNHLATAVRFDKDVKGSCVDVDGVKYTICDPTCYRGKVGRTYSKYAMLDKKDIKIIPLN